MKKLLVLFFFIFTPTLISAQANKQDVKKLLEVSGFSDKYSVIINQLADNLSEDDQDSFKKDVQNYLDKIIKKQIDAYASSFSQDEVLKLIEFYKSPLGIKLKEKSELIDEQTLLELSKTQYELQGILMKYMM
ncbi:DUF2059 domain-containing protein [Flavobacterium sp. I3-2]|uniref:DUF2059 domain-containing protein n=1 Tax=Flavobacterium sp. I3-2 TaxID=2748319 RepID=UPI0015AC9045|nr:DUF2059 domain-containing protein [Flavobacterium sp. I3-2]